MWTQRCACLAGSRGLELVVGGNGNGKPQCEDWWGSHRGMVMVERLELQQQDRGNQKKGKKKSRQGGRLRVEAKVAVGDSGRQARLLTEGVGVGVGVEAATKKSVLEFATGRLPDNVDRSASSNKAATQKRRVVIIAGPTAVGKSRVAIALAKELGGEIISADSIQVYKDMNIGSAKTPMPEREEIPHHLLDMVSPTEEYSASRFFKDARAATELVLARNSVPIVVGGTCSYLRWYMNGKAGAPKATPEVSAALEGEIRRLASRPGGWEVAVHKLAQAGDPATAYTLDCNDWYRLARAFEVLMVSGQPRGAFPKPYNYTLDHMDGSEWDYDYDFQCYFLYQHRAELYHWIDLRCEQMVADPRGLLQEASGLLDLGLMPDTSSASRGIGYQEVRAILKQFGGNLAYISPAMEFLVECRKAGGMTTEERFLAFLSAFQHVSRSLVKKQLKWFRSEQHSDVKRFHWIDASHPTTKILEDLKKEYWRRPGYPSELTGSDSLKRASYKEGKVLKYYEVKNRIFTNSAAVATVLKWVKQTQGNRRLQRSVVRF